MTRHDEEARRLLSSDDGGDPEGHAEQVASIAAALAAAERRGAERVLCALPDYSSSRGLAEDMRADLDQLLAEEP
ncbi:MAG TPA: hypothetical protein VM513_08950 [Kofleriaceae bacterium]|jgi:hypothetical protein|nr:hypothetical protein [Kofleriaceae bacterium]